MNKNTSSRGLGLLLASLSSVLFGLVGITVTAGMGKGLSMGWFLAVRGVFIVCLGVLLCCLNKISLKFDRKTTLKILAYAAANAATNLLLALSYTMIGTGIATTIHYIHPLLIILATTLIFRAKATKQMWIAVAVVVVAMAMMCEDVGNVSWSGIILAFSSAITWSFVLIWYDRANLGDVPSCALNVYIYGVQILLGLGYAFAAGDRFKAFPAAFLFPLIAAVLMFLAECSFQGGLKRVGAGMSGILGIGEPVTTLVLGWLILGEQLTARVAIACVVLLITMAFVIWSDNKNRE